MVRNEGPRDPWHRALVLARGEICDAVSSGELDHDDITALWVEPCAADIFNDPECQAELGMV